MEENHAHHRDQNFFSKSCRRTCFAQHRAITADQCDEGQVTIDMLPEDTLLEIFDCLLKEFRSVFYSIEGWQEQTCEEDSGYSATLAYHI